MKKTTVFTSLIFIIVFLFSSCVFFADSFGTRGEVIKPFENKRLTEPDFVDFNVTRYYYGELSDVQQQAYRIIYNNIFSFPSKIYLPKLTQEELSEVFLAVKYDNPHIIFLDSTYKHSPVSGISCLFPNYIFSEQNSLLRTERLLAVARNILAENDFEDDFQKELFIHDAINKNCVYSDGDNSATAYGAIVDGKAVCEGYSLAAKLLFDMSGISSCVVKGKASDNGLPEITHMWNAVKIGPEWYYLDCTWDDPVTADGSDNIRHCYFNVDGGFLDVNHSSYTVPEHIVCDSMDDNYYVRFKRFCRSDDWRDVLSSGISAVNSDGVAEFRFESRELLESAAAELFDEGGISRLVNVEHGRELSYSTDTDTCSIYIHFAG